MFRQLKNVDSAFRYVRGFTLVLVCCCFLLCCFVLFKSYELSARLSDRIYVMAGDKAIEAFSGSRRENISVEARDHVRTFHTAFFSLDPDEKVIEGNLRRALYLADVSAKRQYDNLKETGYYAGVISGDISQEISVDSVLVDTRVSPIAFRCYGTLSIIRPTSIVIRSLVTQGYLRNVARSDHNPHGFLVEKWETVENRDLKTETR
ncbi:conjugative transposon protein TraK [Sediminibacterium roseum]|uniref:Conjugative transposon protein TraK n=1 Tax=Sediminibacterium roseum TaxID=1978412 RepID=A0ABW9ZXQ1_9BACT|nr:conjugative transposon protein TraK [Sediminibacterium roseum]NCI51300.1 conjugative transposon protein TraK [Sediminibacterium roseum]